MRVLKLCKEREVSWKVHLRNSCLEYRASSVRDISKVIAYGLFCALLGLVLALLLQALDKMNRGRPSTAGEEVSSSKIHKKVHSHQLEN